MAEVVSTRLDAGLLERLDDVRGDASRGAWLAELVTRELTAPSLAGARSPVAASPGSGPRSIGPGLPSPGVTCMWAACHFRDTDRYAVEDPAELQRTNYRAHPRDEDKSGIALCKRHAARLEGRQYAKPLRDLPPAWRSKARQPEPAGQPA